MKIVLSALAGGIHVLAFAPFYWWPLSIVSLALLFYVWADATGRMALATGFVYGLAMFGFGVSWMYISLNTYGGMPALAAGFSVALGIVYISLFPALCGFLQSLAAGMDPRLRLCLFMPALWLLFEWVRGWFLTGFPWFSLGYAYIETPLSNYAPLGGVYLVGLIVAMSVGTLVAVIRFPSRMSLFFLILVILVWFEGWILNTTTWTAREGSPVRIGIVQNNVPFSAKWDAAESERIVTEYIEKSAPLTDRDLVVWPEAAVPDYLDSLSTDFWGYVETHPADFVFGVLYRDGQDGAQPYYNSVAAVTDKIMLYRKQHLVPFGEYFPAQWLFGPLLDRLDIPMSEFSPWTGRQLPLEAAGNRFAVSICFEDAFPNEGRFQVRRAGALLNVSEDIWFGNSLAPHQRLQMARFRARESERPMIRASNTGLSSLINWKGGIEEYAPQFEKAILTGEVQPRSGVTPYVAFGDTPVVVLIASISGFFLVLCLVYRRQASRRYSP
ncbi:MAG: apolipoprotein N-acyltransferase [Gammaproteobacteria bacterium]|nr:apolipoprotein N-acyltransferase [Gammaproteobacteria bacterium]MYD75483.1 apolipoprotein N-acyltransferase [Gammaproteobacteria bacterium]MYJ51648.1 apolipoprotein N-acyltransferase [Gammaproteobacteria bacterium]